MRLYGILLLLVAVYGLSGCTVGTRQEVPPTATLLPALTSLPAKGKVPCIERTGVLLLEYPASIPPYPDSGGKGGRGRVLGEVSPCTHFTITQIAWSIYNREYYVYAETASAKGWIALHLIEVVP
jgi:hypothetical protein